MVEERKITNGRYCPFCNDFDCWHIHNTGARTCKNCGAIIDPDGEVAYKG